MEYHPQEDRPYTFLVFRRDADEWKVKVWNDGNTPALAICKAFLAWKDAQS